MVTNANIKGEKSGPGPLRGSAKMTRRTTSLFFFNKNVKYYHLL